MGWKCSFCAFFIAFTLRILMRHICTEHSYTPNFSIKCDLNGCPNVYTKYKSFYRHVVRDHQQLLMAGRPAYRCQYSVDDETELSDNEINQANDAIPMDNGNEEQNGNNTVQIGDDHSNEQKLAVSYLMGLRENHRIRETTAEAIAEGTNAIVQRHISIIRTNIYQILQREGIDPDSIDGFSSQFDTMLPFENLTTAYEREQYIKRNFFYVNPEYVRVGQNIVDNRRLRARDYIIREENFAYFPMDKSIEQFFQDTRIFEMVRNTRIQNSDDFYSGFSSGNIFRNNLVIQTDINALQILLYYDDLEVCNPMNKKAGSHKLGLFYFTIGNLPVTYRSRLPAIRTLAIIKRTVMNKHSINVVIKRIKQDLDMLERGITMTLSGINYLIKGTCLCFIGDNSAAHEFSGFKVAVGFSFKKCRECEVNVNNMQTSFNERDVTKRTKESYERSCFEMSQADITQQIRTALSRNSGITRKSVASDFPNFDITKMMPQDIMHVMFECVGLYEIKAVLTTLVAEGHFNLNRLNAQIENFRYGFRDRANQPVPIPHKIFTNDDQSLRQSASSMIVLMKLLPFILVEKLNCDPDNQYVLFLTEICAIALTFLSPVISVETILMLKVLIQEHLKQFKSLFPNKNIIPKQHYMIHMPSTIERYGSLTNVWSMRFEGKHQFIKQRLSGSNNFKNVVKSVADRCAMYECSLNCSQEHPLFKNDCLFGKCSASTNLEDAKDTINAFLGIDIAHIQNVFETSWVIFNGQKFIKNECEIAFGESGGLPEFGHLISIWVAKVQVDDNVFQEHIYFRLNMYETINFDATVNAYHVDEPTIAQGLELVHIDNIFVSSALHMYRGTGRKMYIFAPYDLVDVVQFRQTGAV